MSTLNSLSRNGKSGFCVQRYIFKPVIVSVPINYSQLAIGSTSMGLLEL